MAKKEHQELTQEAVDRITRSIRSLAEDHVDRGFDPGRPIRCDSCGLDKPASGSTIYGAYKFCNDCLLDFTLALASGRVDNAAEFMTKRTDGQSPLLAELEAIRENAALRPPIQARDKLMPSNEPC